MWISQVGMSRIGAPVSPRNARGRYVRVAAVRLLETTEPVETEARPNPVRVTREAPVARLVAILTLLAVAGRRVATLVERVLAVVAGLIRHTAGRLALNPHRLLGHQLSFVSRGR